MKLIRKILLVLLVLLVLGMAGGYFFFRDQFKAPPNQLSIAQKHAVIPFLWQGDSLNHHWNPYAALLLPVHLPGCSRTFYMQFDLGSPYTIFYKYKLEAIDKKFNNLSIHPDDDKYFLENIRFMVGDCAVLGATIPVRDFAGFQEAIDWNDTAAIEVIGTIGADIIDQRTVRIDYPAQTMEMYAQLPDSLPSSLTWSKFSFKERRVLLPAIIAGKKTSLFFDTGSSAFELLTDKNTWKKLADNSRSTDTFPVKSWDRTLYAFQAPVNQSITVGKTSLPLKKITYIEGTGFMQNLLMKFSGMGGMTGNLLFHDQTIILDTKQERFAID